MRRGWRLRAAVLLGAGVLSGSAQAAGTATWDTVKSQHFIVMHDGDAAFASRVADKAEAFYQTIGDDLGYSRRAGFWLWENRVRILVYPTVQAFQVANDAPGWAAGRASSKRREIAGCRTSGESFLTSVLPHEMAHLILAEFVGSDRLPQWVNEGFAQWEQGGRKTGPPGGGAKTAWFSLDELSSMDVRQESDTARVHVYYQQAASVVGFLIGTYGGDRFGRFCRAMRDGKALPAALGYAYPDLTGDLASLERRWRQHVGAPER